MRWLMLIAFLIAIRSPAQDYGAWEFDGTNDFVYYENFSQTDQFLGISVWVYWDDATASTNRQTILAPFDVAQADTERGWFTDINGANNQFEFSYNYSGDGIWAFAMPTNEWAHIAVSYDWTSTNNAPEMYLNGVLQSNTVVNAPNGLWPKGFTNNLMLGATDYSSPRRFFSGKIASPRIYDRKLTAAEVDDLYRMGNLPGVAGLTVKNDPLYGDNNIGTNLNTRGQFLRPDGTDWIDPTPASMWRFGTSDTTNDVIGSLNVELNGDATATLNSGLVLDGTNDWGELTTTDALDSHSQGAILAWINTDVMVDNDYIFTYATSSNTVNYGAFGVRGADSTVQFVMRGDSAIDDYSVKAIRKIGAGGWYHVGITCDGTNHVFYINGSDAGLTVDVDDGGSLGAGSWFDDIAAQADRTTIGQFGRNTDINFFDGEIDELMLFDSSLTAEQVYDIYQRQRGDYAGSLQFHGYSKASWGDVITNTFDFSTYGNSGTASNGTTVSSSGNPLKVYESSQTGGWTPIQ